MVVSCILSRAIGGDGALIRSAVFVVLMALACMSACGSAAFGRDIQEVEVSKDELAAVVEQAFGPRPATVSGHKLTDGNEVWYSVSFSTKGYRIKHEGSDRKVCRRFTYFLDIGGPADAPILTNVLHATQFAFPDAPDRCPDTLDWVFSGETQISSALLYSLKETLDQWREMVPTASDCGPFVEETPDAAVCAEMLRQLANALRGRMTDVRPDYEEMGKGDPVALNVSLTDAEAPSGNYQLLLCGQDADFKLLRIEYGRVHDHVSPG